jgi:hypothetical protein
VVSASGDGRSLLLTVVVPQGVNSVFFVRPESGEARPLLRGAAHPAIISADGSRFAVGGYDQDRSATGLWVGMTSDGSMKRLVADDPQLGGSPPIPYAFSPDASALAFGIAFGDLGYRGALVRVDAAESGIDRSADGPRPTADDVSLVGLASGAEFSSADVLLVTSTRTMFGGETVVYLYEISRRRSSELYRPHQDTRLAPATWRPRAPQFTTRESQMCCGAARPESVWLRGRDGSARKLGEWAFLGDMWWSPDGSKLYAGVGGDDSVGLVMDLLTGTRVMTFCRRGGGPPPAACT